MEKTRLKASIVNSAVAIFVQLIIIVSTFVLQTVFIKTLGAQYLGVKGLFTNLMSFLSFAELGVGSAITYSLYKPLSENDEYNVSAVMNLFRKTYNIIGLIILAAGFILSFFIKDMVRDGNLIPQMQFMFILFLLNTVVGYFFTYMRSLLIANQQGYLDSLNRGLFTVILAVIQIIILIKSHNFIFFLISQIIMTLISNLVITRTAYKNFSYLPEYKDAKVPSNVIDYMKKNIFGTISSKIGSVVVFGTDNILISKFIGLSVVGIYSNYMLVISGITSLLNQMLSAVVASLGNLGVTADVEHQYQVFNRYLYVVAFVTYTCATTLLIILNPFIGIWVGAGYQLHITTLFLIVFNFFIIQMRQASLNFISAQGLYWPMRWKSLIEALINLVLSFTLIKTTALGINGVIIGAIISNVIVNIWWEPLILFKYGFKIGMSEYFKKYISYTLVFVLSSVIIYVRLNWFTIRSESFVGICFQSIVVFFSTIMIFISCFWWTTEQKYFFNLIIVKIFKTIRR
ncbi:lipopolysaccharide biosynthesis protein [Leuconostoc citreum]|uniref:lipopolysaccharide biosynthesis protein n=1 Tax=Leuconostoc citreum TaxID=33964 RepID=UPI0021A51A3A|nr:transporter [Leuconostoc citreum]MCT3076264.1 transporter [Leuconostoc citreum]